MPWTLILLLVPALGVLGAVARIAKSRHQRAYDRDPDAATIIYVDAQHR